MFLRIKHLTTIYADKNNIWIQFTLYDNGNNNYPTSYQ